MAEEAARVVIKAVSADGSTDKVAYDLDTDIFSMGIKVPVGVTAEGLQTYNPLFNGLVDEGSSIQVLAAGKAGTGDIIESEESALRIEGMLINKATGATFRKILTFEDMVGFQPSQATNVTMTVATAGLTNLVKLTTTGYLIPAGHQFKFMSGKAHVFLGDDT